MTAVRNIDTERLLTAAALATADAQLDAVGAAEQLAATFPAPTNGYGIYADHRLVLAVLLDARARLSRAIELVQATQWPSAADYEGP